MMDEPDIDVGIDIESLNLIELQPSVGHLQRAVTSHEEVGHAVGVLVAAHRIPPAQAWDLLRRADGAH
jgi:hypothetical protein